MTRRRWYGIAAAVLLAGSAGIGVHAAHSVPGEPSYGLKQAFVEFRTALLPSGATRAERYLDNADDKVLELGELLRQQASEDLIATAAEQVLLSDRKAQAEIATLRERGASPEAVEKVRERAVASYQHRQRQLQPAVKKLQGPPRTSVRRILEGPLGTGAGSAGTGTLPKPASLLGG
ncbi:MAG: hypothetical protein M3N59_00105 [bacterium]|nr:hypothetical protein [bacterium]